MTHQKWWITGVVILYAIGTGVAFVEMRRYPDQSMSAVFRWGMFYLMAVIHPLIWAFLNTRLLRQQGMADERHLRRFVIAPMVVGWLTFLLGLRLIIGV